MTDCVTDEIALLKNRLTQLEALYASTGNPPLVGATGPAGPAGTILANSGVVTQMPPLVSGGSGVTAHTILPPSGAISSAGFEEGLVTKLYTKIGKFFQGPLTRPEYFTHSGGMFFNINNEFGPQNRNFNGAGFWYESTFAQGGPTSIFGGEHHISSFVPTGGLLAPNYTEFRLFSTFVPQNLADWTTGSEMSLMASRILLRDGAVNPRVDFRLERGAGLIDLFPAVIDGIPHAAPYFRVNSNNVPFVTLINAAGTDYVTPFSLSALDRLMFNVPRTESITSKLGSFGAGVKVHIERNLGVLDSNAIGTYVTGNSLIGNFVFESVLLAVSGTLSRNMRNSTASGAINQLFQADAGNITISFENSSLATGPQIRYNAVADQLEIQADGFRGAAATTTAIEISRTMGVVTLTKAPIMSLLGNYANDAAAAAGGVALNQLYHNAGALRIRIV